MQQAEQMHPHRFYNTVSPEQSHTTLDLHVTDRPNIRSQSSVRSEAPLTAATFPTTASHLGFGSAPVRLKRTFDYGVPAVAPAPFSSTSLLRAGPPVQQQHQFLDARHKQQRRDVMTSNIKAYPSSAYCKSQPAESVADTEDFIKAVQPTAAQAAQRVQHLQQTNKAPDGYAIHRSMQDRRGLFCLDTVPCCSGPFTDSGQCVSAVLGGACSCKLKLPLPAPYALRA